MPTDIQIAQAADIQHINTIAEKLDISADDLEHYGKHKAKLPLSLVDEQKVSASKLILVTAMSPTPAGEGKTTTSIGLADGLNRLNHKTTVVLREPSLGPVFGIKGGAAGGGHAQVIPMEDINLHFTGDFSAVEKANNLLSALIDNNLQSKTRSLGIDPRTILWKRVMDMNDRALRQTVVGLGGATHGIPRQDGFNITPASEVMAILCMASGYADLKQRLGSILVGFKMDREPVYARDLHAEEAMAILLKDAIKPNLVQTLEGNPAIIHGGPFANIAQGTNTILATKMGLSLSDYVVTEAGFGADLGAEKFFDIKCPAGDLSPSAVVVVATIRALRYHGGAGKDELDTADITRIQEGLANLDRHISNMKKYGLHPVVAINAFSSDSVAEIELVQQHCQEHHQVAAILARGWADGGAGMEDLAHAVVQQCDVSQSSFAPLYETSTMTMQDKIARVAKDIYGAASVAYTPTAQMHLRRIKRLGLEHLPVCIAKTQKSFSDDAKRLGAPSGYELTVRDMEYAVGAGFIIPICGNIMRMPGLPTIPASEGMSIDDQGKISGLS